MKSLIVFSLPIVFSIFLAIFWILYKFHQKKSFNFIIEKYMITLNIIFFYFQSPIINSLCDILNCTRLGKSSYISVYMIEECFTTSHNHWIFWYIIPGFLIFGVLFPFIAFAYMWINRNNLSEEKIISKIGFLLNGYEKERFYW